MTDAKPYLVCASQRSGSTLLVESLAATGVAGRPAEFFQYFASSSLAPQPLEWFAGVDDEQIVGGLAATDQGTVDVRTAQQWRADVVAAGRTDNGVWGGKLMWNQTPLLIARTRVASGSLRTALRWLLGTDPVFVHVHRDDLIGQAVSMWRAVQTRVWRDSPEPEGLHLEGVPDEEAFYNAEGIAHLAGILADQERRWRTWFDEEGIETVDIEFGELTRDPTGTTGRVLAALGLDPALAPPPSLKPQSNARSKEWALRYRTDADRNGYPR
ncbi:trehalose 2-sulfotransferase [Gordonia crocea]|uniref:Trehalose 2-sulfotransferase n=1 Tax=Gordonia crocea TaxID=589162 RepID=A0A7I9V2H1_9ACTN|nr:Stf0 family sulfotransferase [Gordonia crocea]GED99239.1 trehalose 2-sulfotransferase [Gordonia crocea]